MDDPSPIARGALQPAQVHTTIAALRRRIAERFPGSGLGRVCDELIALARDTEQDIEQLRKPVWWLRALTGVAILAMLITIAATAWRFLGTAPGAGDSVSDMIQGVEAATNELLLLGLTLAFLISLETRVKRRQALRTLHRLRAIAHVVDMHQLTKDPEFVLHPAASTASSPQRRLTRFELVRYLDYCAEMLALVSKLAALHTQELNDAVVLAAVNDIETLTSGLSSKIWQKIMILDMSASVPGE